MFRSLFTLPLPGSLTIRLQKLGFIYWEDVCTFRNGKLLSLDATAAELLKQWDEKPEKYWMELISSPSAKNAFSLLQEECARGGIETFCRPLDEYMDGGIPLKRITEISGAPGTGKTQLCLQLCVDVQIPHAFHGLEGQAVYFDTSNGFILSRVSEIAEACINHCSLLSQREGNQNMVEAVRNFSTNSILQNIFYFRCLNYVDLAAGIIYLKKFLQKNRKVRLIVIDSITFPLQTLSNSLQRVRLLCELVESLRSIAYEFNIAVVVTNNLTTRIEAGKESKLVPALGESFGHSVNYRLMFGRLSQCDFICVSGKNVNKPPSTLPFQITKFGIRDKK